VVLPVKQGLKRNYY